MAGHHFLTEKEDWAFRKKNALALRYNISYAMKDKKVLLHLSIKQQNNTSVWFSLFRVKVGHKSFFELKSIDQQGIIGFA